MSEIEIEKFMLDLIKEQAKETKKVVVVLNDGTEEIELIPTKLAKKAKKALKKMDRDLAKEVAKREKRENSIFRHARKNKAALDRAESQNVDYSNSEDSVFYDNDDDTYYSRNREDRLAYQNDYNKKRG